MPIFPTGREGEAEERGEGHDGPWAKFLRSEACAVTAIAAKTTNRAILIIMLIVLHLSEWIIAMGGRDQKAVD